jgi:branched-chain amino acid transport system permease protein
MLVPVLAVAGLVILGFPSIAPDYYVFVVVAALLASIGAIGANLLIGTAGLVSIGNAAFMAIAAWTVALVSSPLGFVGSVLLGASICGVIGVLIGIPSLRLRNFYMALTTLALHFMVAASFFQYSVSSGHAAGWYLAPPSIGSLVISGTRNWYFLVLLLLAVLLALCHELLTSRVGRAWLAIREHDVAAAVVGVNTRYFKLLAFAVSSFIIGFGGALYAYFTGYVTPQAYTFDVAISYVAMIIIGGLGSLSGAVIGAFVVTLLPFVVQNVGSALFPVSGTGTSFLQQNQFYIESALYGVVVLGFIYREPGGIAGILKRLAMRRLVGSRAEIVNFDFPGGPVRAAASTPGPNKGGADG